MKFAALLYFVPMLVVLIVGTLRCSTSPRRLAMSRRRALLPTLIISIIPAFNVVFAAFELHWLFVNFAPLKWRTKIKFCR